jgi:hypothetical protein
VDYYSVLEDLDFDYSIQMGETLLVEINFEPAVQQGV